MGAVLISVPLTPLQRSIVEIEVIDGAEAEDVAGLDRIRERWVASGGQALLVPDAESLAAYLLDVGNGYDAVAEAWPAAPAQGFQSRRAARAAATSVYALAAAVRGAQAAAWS